MTEDAGQLCGPSVPGAYSSRPSFSPNILFPHSFPSCGSPVPQSLPVAWVHVHALTILISVPRLYVNFSALSCWCSGTFTKTLTHLSLQVQIQMFSEVKLSRRVKTEGQMLSSVRFAGSSGRFLCGY